MAHRWKASSSVQSILLSKRYFLTASGAQLWLMMHGYHSELDETANNYRARQVDPKQFIPGTFRTITFTPGIKAIIGVRKGR